LLECLCPAFGPERQTSKASYLFYKSSFERISTERDAFFYFGRPMAAVFVVNINLRLMKITSVRNNSERMDLSIEKFKNF